ncbi:MAG TPA: hypothetical protein VJZ91_07165 [Blastocatellia bacterium]|nr:hypothetical protein [Blastocatellia bacterium]
MRSNRNDSGNDHHKDRTSGSSVGVAQNDLATSEADAIGNEYVVFDADGLDAPATEATHQNKGRRRRKLIIGTLLILLLIGSVALALYCMLGGNRTPLNLRVHDTRTQESKTKEAQRNPDDVTSQAIAEVRSAIPEPNPPASPIPTAPTGSAHVSPNTPVTVPIESLGGTVSPPATGATNTTTDVQTTTSIGAAVPTGVDNENVTHSNNPTMAPGSRRNPERSIRCAVPAASPSPQTNSTTSRALQHQSEPSGPALSTRNEPSVVLPAFGSMLPVRTLGTLYTLRSGSLVRLELTRDVRGQGWAMRKGTTIVGVSRGSEYDRAYLAIVGFIDSESGRFVKLTGDVLGGDGGSGLRGRWRSLTSAWSRAFSRIGTSAVNVAGLMLGGLGNNSVVVSDAYGYRAVNPISSELSGLISERTNQQQRGFVEVAAGTQGYVMVIDLPQEIRGIDALSELSAKDLAERSDANGVRASTGLSERELADLLSSGSPEQIRAAMPRMTPQMRRVAEAVIAESGN